MLKQIDIALLDFAIVFDTVPRQQLFNKLQCYKFEMDKGMA